MAGRPMFGWFFTFAIGCAATVPAADNAGNDFFEKKIRPVLVEHCYQCHSAGTKEVKGGLLLDTRDGLRKGGENGKSIIPGNPAESLLLQALKHDGLEMPPKSKLPAAVIADFEEWIQMGAPDPRQGSTVGKKIDVAQARKFWSFQPPTNVKPAAVRDTAWPRSELDKYVLAALEARNLKPVADADPAALVKRLSFDLIGLPPPPDVVEQYVRQPSPKMLEHFVDHLLASPQFGERWGRHWLDVARYGESTSKERNIVMGYVWRYRDYVFDSLNADKPFDAFIREQVAGDLLPAANDKERNEHLVATGFLAIGPKSLNEKKPEQFAMDVADEQIDVVTRAVLGVSVACARCHDHKFDPFTQSDYYALAGIFRSTDVLSGLKRGNNKTGYEGQYLQLVSLERKQLTSAERQELGKLEQEVSQAKSALLVAKQAANQTFAKTKNQAKAKKNKRSPTADEEARLEKAERELAKFKEKLQPSAGEAVGVREANKLQDCRINLRGEVDELGDEVARGFPKVLATGGAPVVNRQQSGRMQLAQWLTSKTNPLTARVQVNRIWQHLFGAGLVATVDDFGVMGEQPSHPELLDHLALKYMQQGWSTKKLIREIVLSRTYQLSADHHVGNFEIDPENKYLWRASRRRLDAEALRDAVLYTAGRLDLKRPEGSAAQTLAGGEIGRGAKTGSLTKDYLYRSAYLPMVRGLVPEVLSVFDMADPELLTGKRDVTTVATQALFLLNNDLVQDEAKYAAERVLAKAPADDPSRVEYAFRLILSRPPTSTERIASENFLREKPLGGATGKAAEDRVAAFAKLCHALYSTAEFRYTY